MEIIRASAAAGILACLWKNTPVPHAVESNPSTSCLCLCFFGRPGHENVWEPPRFHMCGYLFETFPPVLASCSTFYLLVCSRVSRGRRGSEALSHAVRLKSTPLLSFAPPPPFFWHLANYERRSGCLQTLQRVNAKIRCLNSADWNLLLAIFMWLVRHPSWLWLSLLSRVLAVTFPTRAAFSLL